MLYTTTQIIETNNADQNWTETHRRRASVAAALVIALNNEHGATFGRLSFVRNDRFSDYAADKQCGSRRPARTMSFHIRIGEGSCRVQMLPVSAMRGTYSGEARNRLRMTVAGKGASYCGNLDDVVLNEGKHGFVMKKVVAAVEAACIASADAVRAAAKRDQRSVERKAAAADVQAHAEAQRIPCRIDRVYADKGQTDLVDIKLCLTATTAKRLIDVVRQLIDAKAAAEATFAALDEANGKAAVDPLMDRTSNEQYVN